MPHPQCRRTIIAATLFFTGVSAMSNHAISFESTQTGAAPEGWTSTLRACSAHDAYLRTYQQGVDEPRVVEFLLVDRLFPRSVFYALRTGERALARLDPASGRSGLDEPAHRAIGRARTDLEFLSAAKLLEGLPDRLLGLQRAVSTISEEVTERLFAGSPPPQWGLKETQA
jgi:uncharacterized alpha-E superfamily protein